MSLTQRNAMTLGTKLCVLIHSSTRFGLGTVVLIFTSGRLDQQEMKCSGFLSCPDGRLDYLMIMSNSCGRVGPN
eukprot:scaffold210232_cov17-Prasinocladus_malaysianus.AAC.1